MADSRRPIRFLTSLSSLRIAMPQASDPVLKSAERFEDEVLDLVGHGPTAMGEIGASVRRYLSGLPGGEGVEYSVRPLFCVCSHASTRTPLGSPDGPS